MTPFTRLDYARAEANYLAAEEDRPYAIVRSGEVFHVLPHYEARYQRAEIVEVVGLLRIRTIFTSATAAIDEAAYLANQHNRPMSIVRHGNAMAVVPYSDAWSARMEILETVTPVLQEDAA